VLVFGTLASTGVIAGKNSITGTVEKTDQGIVFSANNGETYKDMKISRPAGPASE